MADKFSPGGRTLDLPHERSNVQSSVDASEAAGLRLQLFDLQVQSGGCLRQPAEGETMKSLKEFSAQRYSQHGEDGLIEEILRRISKVEALDRWCVEFGAWDGVYLSNTCNLIRNFDYNAVLIEGESSRVPELEKNHPTSQVIKICEFVTLAGPNKLDAILKRTAIPLDFDLLSIDIDGCDYWVLESLQHYQPKIVVIEYNPTIPNAVDYIQAADFSVKHGSSAKSIVNLAQSRGYSLVAVTECNLIFVKHKFDDAVLGNSCMPARLGDLRDDSGATVYAFSGYDGTLILSTSLDFPWHGLSFPERAIQPIPRILRRFPGDWGMLRKAIHGVRYPRATFHTYRSRSRRMKVLDTQTEHSLPHSAEVFDSVERSTPA